MRNLVPYWLAGIAFTLASGAFAHIDSPSMAFATFVSSVLCFFLSFVVYGLRGEGQG